MKQFEIRLIQQSDIESVLGIYKHYVDHTSISFEYKAPSLEEYEQRIKTNTEKYPWLVCLCDEKVIGFAYGSAHRNRTAYQWSPESTIYVSHNFHTKGIGRILYETLFSLLREQGYYTVYAGVSLPNEKSERFHTALGFEEIGVFKNAGYKQGNWHDTRWFQLKLKEYDSHPQDPLMLDELRSTNKDEAILIEANKQLTNINL